MTEAATFLKPHGAFAQLETLAHTMTDTQCADRLNSTREKLLLRIQSKKRIGI